MVNFPLGNQHSDAASPAVAPYPKKASRPNLECIREVIADLGAQHPGAYLPSTQLKISGATMVASLSTMNLGVFWPSLPQVIFSFGTAPE